MNRKEFYNQKSPYRMNATRRRHILDLIPSGTKTVLDVGCGEGDLAHALKERGYVVTGVDVSSRALEEADSVLHDSVCFDVESAEWPKEMMERKFDLIVASEVLEHLFDPAAFLRKATDILSPNGKIIITIPNFLFWKKRLKLIRGIFYYEEKGLWDSGHIRFFTVKTAREFFNKEGFVVEKEHHFYPNLYKRKLTFLGDLFSGFFAYQMIFLLSRKK